MFDNLVNITESICQNIDSGLASMTIFDTSGIEAYVQENNPKFINALIKRLKTWKTAKGLGDSYDSYKNEDKSLADSKALLPTLKDFFEKHPSIKPSVFLGDASFDSIDIYKELLGKNGHGFSKAFIPFNSAHDLKYPCCPNDPTPAMNPKGSASHLRCGIPTLKFVCPKMRWVRCEDGKYRHRTSCEDPFTDSPCGRMFFVYPAKKSSHLPWNCSRN